MALLKWVFHGWSAGDIAALIDEKKSRVVAMLAGDMPWKAESYILAAERQPEVSERIVVAYVHYVSTQWGHEWIQRIIDSLRALQDGRIEVTV